MQVTQRLPILSEAAPSTSEPTPPNNIKNPNTIPTLAASKPTTVSRKVGNHAVAAKKPRLDTKMEIVVTNMFLVLSILMNDE